MDHARMTAAMKTEAATLTDLAGMTEVCLFVDKTYRNSQNQRFQLLKEYDLSM